MIGNLQSLRYAPISVGLIVRDVASAHCASIRFRIETSFPSDNIMKKFKPPERQLSHGKLEDEEMNLGQVPVCHQCFH